MKNELDCIEINPSTKPKNSIILLHGLGANGQDFVPIVKELNLSDELRIRFIFPNAPSIPVTINNGYVMPAWYDIYSIGSTEHIDEKGIQESINLVYKYIDREIQLGIDTQNIILAGFSQGAAIALTAGLLYEKTLKGIIGLSGYLPHTDKVLSKAHSANFTTPIFLAHGTNDMVVPFFLGERVFQALTKNKYLVNFNSYPMDHSVCLEEIGDIAEWLQKICLQ